MIDPQQKDALERIRGILGEHFDYFHIAILHEANLFYLGSSHVVTKMLNSAVQEDIVRKEEIDNTEWEWEDAEVEEEEEED